jgi:uncharacterized protein YraI
MPLLTHRPTLSRFSMLSLALACILLTGCTLNLVGMPTPTVSGPPVVRFSAPSADAVVLEGVTLAVQAAVSNAGADIARVVFLADGQVLAELADPNPDGAFQFSASAEWAASGEGAHTLTVTAFRADGSASEPVSLRIFVTTSPDGLSPEATAEATAVLLAPDTTAEAAPPASAEASPTARTVQATPTRASTSISTPATLTATFSQPANVRSGPGLEYAPPIGAFGSGQVTEVLAVNASRTWFKVRYGSGTGWVSAALIILSADPSGLPVESGPPPPTPTSALPTMIPLATNTPQTSINLVAGTITLLPSAPVCNQTFIVAVDVANFGAQASTQATTVRVSDARASDGTPVQTVSGDVPPLDINQQVRVEVPITVNAFTGEDHTLTITLDPDNLVPETQDTDNERVVTYTLARGACP